MDCPVQNYVTFTTAAECAAEVNKMRAAFGVRCRVFDGQTALWSGFSLEQNLQWLTLASPKPSSEIYNRRSALLAIYEDSITSIHSCPVLYCAAGKLLAAAMHPGCIHILINPTQAISSSCAIYWQQLLKRAELWLEHVWIFEFGSQHIEEAA